MKPETYQASNSKADLSCEVKEDNTARRERYSAEWLDTSIFTRPEERCTSRDADIPRRESFAQQGQTHFLVQRTPAKIMRMGRLGHHLTQYQLPYYQTLPLPIFKPADLTAKIDRMATPPQVRGMIEFERALSNPGNDGICQDKTPVSKITKELPPVMQPARMEFAKNGLAQSLPRSLSQEAQRG